MAQRLFTIFLDDDELWPFHRSIHPDDFVYLISWRLPTGERVVKVGETWRPKRWRVHLSRGARLELAVRSSTPHALALERDLHAALEKRYTRAFASREHASQFLGGDADGWTECYVADPVHVRTLMLDIIRRREPSALVQG